MNDHGSMKVDTRLETTTIEITERPTIACEPVCISRGASTYEMIQDKRR